MTLDLSFPFEYDKDRFVLYKDVTNGMVYAFPAHEKKYIEANFTNSNEDLSYTTFEGFLFSFDKDSGSNKIDMNNKVQVSAGRLAPL
jgi:hypothetical protein